MEKGGVETGMHGPGLLPAPHSRGQANPPSLHTHKAPAVGHFCGLYEVSPAPEEAGGAHPGLRNTTVPNPGE